MQHELTIVLAHMINIVANVVQYEHQLFVLPYTQLRDMCVQKHISEIHVVVVNQQVTQPMR